MSPQPAGHPHPQRKELPAEHAFTAYFHPVNCSRDIAAHASPSLLSDAPPNSMPHTLPSTGIHSGLRSCTICSGSKPGKRRLRERPKKKRCRNSATLFTNVLSSGKKGIRTPETLLRFTRFPGGPVQPLLHLSVRMAQKYAIFPDSANDGDFFCTVPPGTDSVQARNKSQAPA